jgi:hypothetical protein
MREAAVPDTPIYIHTRALDGDINILEISTLPIKARVNACLG